MLGSIGFPELLVLLVVGLFVFGPERLPKVIADVGKVVRQLRAMANDVTDDLKAELGPELADLDLRSLHPRALVEKHLLAEDDDEPATPPVTPAQREAPVALHKVTPVPPPGTPFDADAT